MGVFSKSIARLLGLVSAVQFNALANGLGTITDINFVSVWALSTHGIGSDAQSCFDAWDQHPS